VATLLALRVGHRYALSATMVADSA